MSVKKTTAEGTETEAKQNDAFHILLDLKRRLRFHRALGIKEYPRNADVERFLSHLGSGSAKSAKRSVPRQPDKPVRPGSVDIGDGKSALAALDEEVASCRFCPVSAQRQGTVSGKGNAGARLMVVGDWSRQDDAFGSDVLFGRDEDAMLWKMMAAIDLGVDQVYVTNCLKCCPEKGTEPDAETVTKCFSYLEREIAAAGPVLICAMGEMAARALLGTAAPLFRLRGRIGAYRYQASESVAVMPTFHPRFLLKNPEMKKATWQDLQLIKRYLVENRG